LAEGGQTPTERRRGDRAGKCAEALTRLFTGENFGKQLLKIADPPLERVNL
jgi:NADPH-dependent curcumin reductase CurA